jgi:hypothetical protein
MAAQHGRTCREDLPAVRVGNGCWHVTALKPQCKAISGKSQTSDQEKPWTPFCSRSGSGSGSRRRRSHHCRRHCTKGRIGYWPYHAWYPAEGQLAYGNASDAEAITVQQSTEIECTLYSPPNHTFEEFYTWLLLYTSSNPSSFKSRIPSS